MVDLPSVDGREQSGIRPAVILQDELVGKESPLVVVVPLSSRLGAKRFPTCTTVEPSGSNGPLVRSVALGFQIRAADRNRFMRRMDALSLDDFRRVDAAVRTLLGH